MGDFSEKLFGWSSKSDSKFSNTFRTIGVIVLVIVVIMIL